MNTNDISLPPPSILLQKYPLCWGCGRDSKGKGRSIRHQGMAEVGSCTLHPMRAALVTLQRKKTPLPYSRLVGFKSKTEPVSSFAGQALGNTERFQRTNGYGCAKADGALAMWRALVMANVRHEGISQAEIQDESAATCADGQPKTKEEDGGCKEASVNG